MAKARQGNPRRAAEEELSEIADDMESVTASDEVERGSEYETQGAEGEGMSGNSVSDDGEGRAASGGSGSKVADVMTAEPRMVTPETPIEEAARLFADLDSGALPVVESEDDPIPIGMVTDRDIVTRVLAHGENPFELTVSDCMTTPALTIGRDDDVNDAVHIFEQAQVRRAIVVDDDGRCCGILAQADLAYVVDDALVAEMMRAVSRPTEEAARLPKR